MSLAALTPVVVVLVLVEVCAGACWVVYLGDLTGDAGRGFAGTTAAILVAVMLCDLGLLAILPEPGGLIHRQVDADAFASLVHWAVAFTVALAAYALFCAVGTDAARRVVGAASPVCAGVVLWRGAEAFGSPLLGGRAGLVALLPAALLAGSSLAGMLLGHWYLVAPDLSFRPLRRAVGVIFVTLAVQATTIAVAVGVADDAARATVLGDSTFWLLVVATGVVVTAGVNALTLHFARIRANQPATAMLYILIITTLMGVVPAHLLYFSTRVPV